MSPRKRKKCRFQIETLERRIALSYLEGVPTAPAVVAPKPGEASTARPSAMDAKLRGWHLADTGPAEAAHGPTAPSGPGAAPGTGRGGASTARPTLRLGSQGEDVKSLQGSLERLGYAVGSRGADGKFGPATETAVRAFQEKNGLDHDGIVGPQTWGALERAVQPVRERQRTIDAKLRGWDLADTGPAEAAHGPTAPSGPGAAPGTERGEASKQKIDVAAFIPGNWAPPPPAGADHRTGLLLPAAITPGTDKYYQLRARDFMKRHPEMSPPDYYLSYGDYYMRTLLGINFSDEGKAWAGRTRDALQRAIEKKRMEDPYGFDSLERDPDRFRDYAFSTHYKAYSDSGFYQLSAQDIIKLTTHIKLHDLLSREGLHQDYDLGAGKITHIKDDFVSIGRTFREAVVETGEMIKGAGNEAEKINDFISARE